MPQDNDAAALAVAEAAAHPQHYLPPTPAQVVEQATNEAEALARIIEEQHLYAVTGTDRRTGQEKRHVMVEGWQTLGAMRGVFAVTEWSRRTPDYVPLILESEWYTDQGRRRKRVNVVQKGHGGFEARIQLVNAAGTVVGAAEAECTWEEDGWQQRPSNALRSMAQTRAIGKAYRGVFAFVMALAGYEATPQAEMPPAVPEVPDLHNLPPGHSPEAWAKKVALVVCMGDVAMATSLYADALAECSLEAIGDAAEAEMVVEALHVLNAPFGQVQVVHKPGDPPVTETKKAPAKKAPAKKAPAKKAPAKKQPPEHVPDLGKGDETAD